jgi:hypothetical protein
VIGAPLGPVVREPAGDCQTMTQVLYTERQRLELHPAQDWPYRVSGTQLGVELYKRAYHTNTVQRREDLETAFADERFKAFFQQYGGLPVFGYPISGLLSERDEQTGRARQVQYFERARFELADDPGGDLLHQVRLGALGREYPGIAAQCGAPADAKTQVKLPPVDRVSSVAPSSVVLVREQPWWLLLLLLVGVMLALFLVVRAAWNIVFDPIRRAPRRRAVARRPQADDDAASKGQ